MKWVVLVAVALGVFAGSAQGAVRPGATAILVEDGEPDHPYQRWVNRARVPTPPGAILVAERVGSVTGTEPGTRTIWLSVSLVNPWEALMHELGHNFDYYALGARDRTRFQAILGDHRPWAERGPGTVRELFADAYAICARWRHWRAHRDEHLNTETTGLVGFTRQRRLCRLIWAYQ